MIEPLCCRSSELFCFPLSWAWDIYKAGSLKLQKGKDTFEIWDPREDLHHLVLHVFGMFYEEWFTNASQTTSSKRRNPTDAQVSKEVLEEIKKYTPMCCSSHTYLALSKMPSELDPFTPVVGWDTLLKAHNTLNPNEKKCKPCMPDWNMMFRASFSAYVNAVLRNPCHAADPKEENAKDLWWCSLLQCKHCACKHPAFKMEGNLTDNFFRETTTFAITNIAAMSLATGTATEASLPHVMTEAFKNLLCLCLGTNYTFDEYNAKTIVAFHLAGEIIQRIGRGCTQRCRLAKFRWYNTIKRRAAITCLQAVGRGSLCRFILRPLPPLSSKPSKDAKGGKKAQPKKDEAKLDDNVLCQLCHHPVLDHTFTDKKSNFKTVISLISMVCHSHDSLLRLRKMNHSTLEYSKNK